MNVLDVSPRVVYPPWRGSVIRIYSLLRELSRRHEVRQFSQVLGDFSFRELVEERALASTYREFRYAHPLAWLALEPGRRACLGAPVLSGLALRLARPALLGQLLAWADVALVEFPWQFEHCRRHNQGARLVLSCHNVEALKFGSWAQAARRSIGSRWLRYIQMMEARAAARADLVVTVSAADREEMLGRYRLDPARVVLVPNGAEIREHLPATAQAREAAKRRLGLPDVPTVLYAASDIPPNRRGLDWIHEVAGCTDRFTFLVVGSVADEGSLGGHVVAAGSVDDIDPYLEAADMAICPIEHGGGTKIKLLEAFGAGLPTVAFADALNGLGARDGAHVLVAEKSADGLLSALNRLADQPEMAQVIGRSARRLAAERYDWSVIARTLEGHLMRLTEDGPTTP